MITINLDKIELLIPVLVSIIGAYFAFKIGIKPEKQKTYRMMYEKSFTPIFKYVEKDLYSRSLTLKETHETANQILKILSNSNGYYHPSVKDYAMKLKRSNEKDYVEQWLYFSERFSYRYDKLCKDIGVPLRHSAYRLNQNQYKDRAELVKLYFKLTWSSWIMIIILFYLLYRWIY